MSRFGDVKSFYQVPGRGEVGGKEASRLIARHSSSTTTTLVLQQKSPTC